MEEAMGFSAAEQEEASFPVGYRFSPTDEELIVYYLMKKPSIHPLSMSVYSVDVYELSPWSLQRLYPAIRSQSVYFITQRNRKYALGLRPNREAGEGRWKLSSKDTMIKDKNGKFTGGVRKSLAYHSTVTGKEDKTTWRMHEYRIGEPGDEKNSAKLKTPGPKKLDGVVLCRIYKTNRKSKSTELKEDGYGKYQGDHPMLQPRVKMEDGDSGYSMVPLNAVDIGAPSCGFDIPLVDNFTPLFDQHNYNDQLTSYNEMPSLPSYDSYFGDRDFPQMHHALSYYDLPSTSLVQPQPLQLLVPSSSNGCSHTNFGEYIQSFETEISVPVPVPVPEPEHEEDRFPVGVRFQPTDDEIISYYLMNKPSNFPPASVVHMEDYYKYEPWVLHDMYPMVRVKERYFITHREKKYEGGDRPNRMAGCGHWKASGKQTPVLDNRRRSVGLRQTLIYYIMPGDKKTDWIMQEFRIGELGEKKLTEKHSGTMRLQGYVFCKLYLHQKKRKFEDDDHDDQPELDPALESGTIVSSSASALDELDSALVGGTIPSQSVGCPSASAQDALDPALDSGTTPSLLDLVVCPSASDALDLALDSGAIPSLSDLVGSSSASALDGASFDYDSFFADPPIIESMNLWNTNYGYDEEVPAKRSRFSMTDSDGLTTSVHVPPSLDIFDIGTNIDLVSPSNVLRSNYFEPREEGKDGLQDLFFWENDDCQDLGRK